MKIYDSNINGAPADGAQRTQQTQQAGRIATGRASGSGGASEDRVEFSGTLGRLSQVLSTFQSDRSSRVQMLAAQYQSGSYRPDSAATSRAMISDTLDGALESGLQ